MTRPVQTCQKVPPLSPSTPQMPPWRTFPYSTAALAPPAPASQDTFCPSHIRSVPILACLALRPCHCPRTLSDFHTPFRSPARTHHASFPPSACIHTRLRNKQNHKHVKYAHGHFSKFVLYSTTNFAFAFTQLIIPTNSHHIYTHYSHVRISHQLCSIRFYCNCKKFYHYDLFHVRQNRSYEVGICSLREKENGTRTHCAEQQKYTKTKKYEYEGKERKF